jgi:hypothetical protein
MQRTSPVDQAISTLTTSTAAQLILRLGCLPFMSLSTNVSGPHVVQEQMRART